jgi:hypothetical protein
MIAVAVGAASAAWVAMHRASGSSAAAGTPADAATPRAAGVSAPAPLQTAVATAPSSAAAVLAAASALPGPPVESAAESLRKVQLAWSGGSAQDDLVAAITLESCAHADKTASDLVQGRDAVKWLPPELKKILEKLPTVTDEAIARAQREQRRCQVFDAAALASRGELYRKAFEGGAEGAALPYLRWLATDGAADKPAPELTARLQAGVRADAQAADLSTLAAFAYGGKYTTEQAGADRVQAGAYKEAYLRIVGEGSPAQAASARDMVSNLSLLAPAEPAMTAQQQQQADALARQVVDAWHRRRHS